LKVGLFGNYHKKAFLELLPDFLKWIASKKNTLLLHESLTPFLDDNDYENVSICDSDTFVKVPDAYLTFGGDGTILHLNQMIYARQKPILGINLGRLGFLTEVQMDDLYDKITAFLKGDYAMDERMMLQAQGQQRNYSYHVLNDVVVTKTNDARLIRISIYLDDIFFNRFIADGVIVSTPTGSTAYNLSANGPVILPDTSAFVISPICPHSLSIRSVVVSAEARIRIQVETDAQRYAVSMDGQYLEKCESGNEIVIQKSQYKAKLVRFPDSNFAKTLRTKLLWSEDLRDRQKFDV
jgi:NAD+ kinase